MPAASFPDLVRERLEELFPTLLERVANRESMTTPRLPAAKDESPKLLCLDQNKWIALARAHYGQGEPNAVRALHAIRHAIREQRLLVPVLTSNLMEAGEHSDPARRERLANFIVELSGNTSIVNNVPIVRAELQAAVFRSFLGIDTNRFRDQLVRRGMGPAAGLRKVVATGNDQVDRLLNETLLEPEVSALMLAHGVDRETDRRSRQSDAAGAEVIAQIRQLDAHLSLDDRRRLELRNLLREGRVAAMLWEAIGEAQVDGPAFEAWLEDDNNCLRFAAEVPSIDVKAELMLARDRNSDAPTRANDGKDFTFLEVAIPYANFVVTERMWAHVARSCRLDEKYGTLILASLKDLADVLEGVR